MFSREIEMYKEVEFNKTTEGLWSICTYLLSKEGIKEDIGSMNPLTCLINNFPNKYFWDQESLSLIEKI